MSNFIRITTAAALAFGLAVSASTIASARNISSMHTSSTPAPGLSGMQNSATPAPGMSSVPQGGALNPGAHPDHPGPGVGGNGGTGGKGGSKNHGTGVSFGIYQNFDPNTFCRYTIRKHRPVKICYLAQADYAPSFSLSFGY